jgi:cytoskeletal protein RodZ
VSIGDTLAEARHQAGLSITQVSQQTRIRETIIRGIEQGDFSACGGDFYARGHIKSIARAVGLDPDQVVREFDATHGTPHAIRAAEVFEPSTPIQLKERRSLNWSVAMVAALAIIIGFVVYHAVSGPPHRATPAAADTQRTGSSSPAPQHSSSSSPSSPPPSAAASYSRELVIKLTVKTQPCWVEFTRYPGGGYVLQRYLQAGQTKTWRFKHAVSMQIGNPTAVVLTVNGRHRLSPGVRVTPVTLSFHPVRQLSN